MIGVSPAIFDDLGSQAGGFEGSRRLKDRSEALLWHADRVAPGHALAASQEHLETLPGYGRDVKANQAKAKQLLKEAGYGPGNPLKFQIWTFTEPGESEGPAVADALSIYFKNVGVNAEVQMHDWAKIRTTYRNKQSKNFMWTNIIGWRPSDQGIRNFYYSKGNNHHYEDDFLEKTYGEVMKTTDAKKRSELMRSIGDHIQAEYADIPLFWFRNEVFANPKVVGDWVYPGPAAGRSSHFELIKLVK